MFKRIISDLGFMGQTHSTSALAAFLLLVVLTYETFLQQFNPNLLMIVICAFVATGFALLPDLDNTKSTAISTLGPVGRMASMLVRGSSVAIYTILHTKSDGPDADPHRGFWHTGLSGVLVGGAIAFAVTIPGNVELFGMNNTIGFMIAALVVAIGMQLTIASLLTKRYRKFADKVMGGALLFIINVAIAFTLLSFVPNESLTWVGYAAGFGWLAHIVGDMFTVSGAPLLFPLPIRKKMWFNLRSPIHTKANSDFEKKTLRPLLKYATIILMVIALITVII